MTWSILHGDCVEVMASLPAQSVDAVITSPPYAMQRKATYGGVPEAEYPGWTVAWMEQARRLLKPDGSVVINIRPHVRNGQISDYTLRTRLALREAGWCEVDELIWHKSGPPLGHPKRPRRSWESLHWFALHGRPFADPKAAGQESTWTPSTRGRGGPHINAFAAAVTQTKVARVADVVSISTRLNESSDGTNDHPAPYPPALAEWVAKLICPVGGTILDPFSGSASTGVAAVRSGWDYIGIDAVAEYVEMSRLRLAQVAA